MLLNDYIAIGILGLCVVLGLKGFFRWVSGAFVGLLLGALILIIAAALCFVPFAGDRVRGPLTRGIIVPHIAEQLQRVGRGIGLDVPVTTDRKGSLSNQRRYNSNSAP